MQSSLWYDRRTPLQGDQHAHRRRPSLADREGRAGWVRAALYEPPSSAPLCRATAARGPPPARWRPA